MPQGMQCAPRLALCGGPRTTQVCLTQAMIDKYGAPMPQSSQRRLPDRQRGAEGHQHDRRLDLQRQNGRQRNSGIIVGHPRSRHRKSAFCRNHAGMAPNSRPIEYTINSSSVYKGPDCGSVQPAPMPSISGAATRRAVPSGRVVFELPTPRVGIGSFGGAPFVGRPLAEVRK
jgi:hypothetical protein